MNKNDDLTLVLLKKECWDFSIVDSLFLDIIYKQKKKESKVE